MHQTTETSQETSQEMLNLPKEPLQPHRQENVQRRLPSGTGTTREFRKLIVDTNAGLKEACLLS
mgnify:CR=1 FL=1